MRRVIPTKENTNSRNYYMEVLPIVHQPWNYLVIFRPLELFKNEQYFWSMERRQCYYFGLLATSENLKEATQRVNEYFCENDLRDTNSDRYPEPIVPIPLDNEDVMEIEWYKQMNRDDKLTDSFIAYLSDDWAHYPTDETLTPTKIDGIVERLTQSWILS